VLIGNGSPVTSESMTFYILSGNGYVEMNGIKENIKDGTAVKIPTGSSHSICNESPENMNFIFCFNPPVKIGSYDKK
jgi:mannose-6-phosphate isomerase-like protein (cupin superfamily)